jgi:hypothetical protein
MPVTAGSSGRGAVLRTAAGNHRLRRVLAAYFLFDAAEWGAWIATLVWAYGVGGVRGASLMSVVQLVPAALAAPVVASWCERRSRARALALGYAAQSVCFAGLGVSLISGVVPVVVVAAVASCVAITATRPVHNAILGDLADTTAELTASNSLSGTGEASAAFVGPLAIGLLMVPWGAGGAVLVVACWMAIASVLVMSLTTRRPAPQVGSDDESGVQWRALVRDPTARIFAMTTFTEYLLLGSLDILLVVLALDILGLSQSGPGVLNSAVGIGGVIGTAATVMLVGRRHLAGAVILGALLTGVPIALAAAAPTAIVALVLVALSGAGKLYYDVAARTLVQRSMADRLLVSVFAMQESLMSVGIAAGAVVTPLLIAVVGTSGAFVVVGLLLPMLSLVIMPGLRRVDARSVVSPEDVSRLQRVPFLAILPPLMVERLAKEQTRHVVPAGAWLVRQGDRGDAFYVIESGRLEVTQQDSVLRELGPGDWFGELALLRDVPRTASVRALTEVSVMALERGPFLSAVTGVPQSVEAARADARRYPDLDPDLPGDGAAPR